MLLWTHTLLRCKCQNIDGKQWHMYGQNYRIHRNASHRTASTLNWHFIVSIFSHLNLFFFSFFSATHTCTCICRYAYSLIVCVLINYKQMNEWKSDKLKKTDHIHACTVYITIHINRQTNCFRCVQIHTLIARVIFRSSTIGSDAKANTKQ